MRYMIPIWLLLAVCAMADTRPATKDDIRESEDRLKLEITGFNTRLKDQWTKWSDDKKMLDATDERLGEDTSDLEDRVLVIETLSGENKARNEANRTLIYGLIGTTILGAGAWLWNTLFTMRIKQETAQRARKRK